MNEVMCFVIGFIGGGLSGLMIIAGVKQALDMKMDDIKVQLFALRIALNTYNDDSSNAG